MELKLLKMLSVAEMKRLSMAPSLLFILVCSNAKGCFEKIIKSANQVEIRRGMMLVADAVIAKFKSNKQKSQIFSLNLWLTLKKLLWLIQFLTMETRTLVIFAMQWKWLKKECHHSEVWKTLNDSLYIVEGIKFDRGYIFPYFTNTSKGQNVNCKMSVFLWVNRKILCLVHCTCLWNCQCSLKARGPKPMLFMQKLRAHWF